MIMAEQINYNDLLVDKENEWVKYNDKLHKYWTKDTKQNCISVTTLIHKFTVFDEDFWSSYKAFEALLGESKFKEFKPRLLDTKKFTLEYLDQAKISQEDFDKKKNEILAEWEEKEKLLV